MKAVRGSNYANTLTHVRALCQHHITIVLYPTPLPGPCLQVCCA